MLLSESYATPYGPVCVQMSRKVVREYQGGRMCDVEAFDIRFDAESFVVNGIDYRLMYVLHRTEGREWSHSYRSMIRAGCFSDNPTSNAAKKLRDTCTAIAESFDTEENRRAVRADWYAREIESEEEKIRELTEEIATRRTRISQLLPHT